MDIRTGTPTDHPYIYSSWIRSLRPSVRDIESAVYSRHQHNCIEKILADPATIVLIASPDDDHDLIYGYVVGQRDPATIHYVCVKESRRRTGIAAGLVRAIVGDAAFRFTHASLMGAKLASVKAPQGSYVPYGWTP